MKFYITSCAMVRQTNSLVYNDNSRETERQTESQTAGLLEHKQ